MPLRNKAATAKWFSALEKKPERLFRIKMQKLTVFVHKGVTSKTPVFTGKSLRNWQWTMDEGFSGVLEAAGSGPTGQTSQMPIGTEPRRSANMASPDASLSALNYSKPFRKYILTNNSENIIPLEFGQLPSSDTSRSPAGMLRITVENLKLLLSR